MNSQIDKLSKKNQMLKTELQHLESLYLDAINKNTELRQSMSTKKAEFEELLEKATSLKNLVQIQEETIFSENDSFDTSLHMQITTLNYLEQKESINKWITQREQRRDSIDQRTRRNYSMDVFR